MTKFMTQQFCKLCVPFVELFLPNLIILAHSTTSTKLVFLFLGRAVLYYVQATLCKGYWNVTGSVLWDPKEEPMKN